VRARDKTLILAGARPKRIRFRIVDGTTLEETTWTAKGVAKTKTKAFPDDSKAAHAFDDAVRKKPDAAPLDLCAARLGIATRQLLMVGDSGNDVAAARAAGCPVLVVPYGYREGLPVQKLGADGIVDSFVALAQCVQRAGNT